MSPDQVNRLLEVPASDSTTPVKEKEAAFIYNFLKEKGIRSTCEVGFAYARSASHIMAATGANHIVMDPYQGRYGNHGLENVKRLGLTQQLEFHDDFSHNVLPRLLAQGRRFEFIFIDGDHKFDGEFIDYYFADLLLNANGYMLFHDTWMRSTRLVTSFIDSNRPDYKKTHTPLRNFALYQKIGHDSRNGMHFKEFYTFGGTLTHYPIIWMSEGESTWLKRLVHKAKNMAVGRK